MSGVYRLTRLGRHNADSIQKIDTRAEAIMSFIKENGEVTLEEIEYEIKIPAKTIMDHLVARKQVEEN